ncbi:MAG: hypothetical protein PF795_05465 [Kiritimatiellae bacterium]|jgi:hypothetical protein|nr:hypothetical protein [Kiritimatiellia bacterium]
MNSNQTHVLLRVLTIILLTALPVSATVLLQDEFDTLDSNWDAATNVNISLDTNDQLGSGNSLSGNVNNSVNLLATSFASQTLSAPGHSLSLSFDYRWNGSPSSGTNDRVPAFGLYNSNGTGAYTDDVGVHAYMWYTTHEMLVMSETGGDNTALAGSDLFQIGNYQYGASKEFDGSERRFSLTLMRISDDAGDADNLDDLQIAVSVEDPVNSGNNFNFSEIAYSGASSEIPTWTFDEVTFRSRNTDYYFDNVEVSVIPEPGTLGLVLGGLVLTLLSVGRRFR